MGYYINNTWEQGLSCSVANVGISTLINTPKEVKFIVDMTGRLLDKDRLPLNQLLIKVYSDNSTEKFMLN